METSQRYFYKLCNEIDEWRRDAIYWENKYKEMEKKYNDLLTDSITHSQNMVANQLKFCLNTSEDKLKEIFGEKVK